MQSKIEKFNNLGASPRHLRALPSHLRDLHLAALAWAASEFGLAVAWAPVGFSTGLTQAF